MKLTKREIKTKFCEFYPKYKEGAAYTKLANWIAQQDELLFDTAAEVAESSTYTTKKYGRGWVTICSSAEHGQLVPWEASRYPKAAALVGFAMVLCKDE